MSMTIFLNGALIIIAEGFLWMLFRRKVTGIAFPHDTDASFFRFFTLTRITVIAIVHTAILVIGCTILIITLW